MLVNKIILEQLIDLFAYKIGISIFRSLNIFFVAFISKWQFLWMKKYFVSVF